MTMMALALGEDTLSTRNRREAIIDDLFNLPSSITNQLSLTGAPCYILCYVVSDYRAYDAQVSSKRC